MYRGMTLDECMSGSYKIECLEDDLMQLSIYNNSDSGDTSCSNLIETGELRVGECTVMSEFAIMVDWVGECKSRIILFIILFCCQDSSQTSK